MQPLPSFHVRASQHLLGSRTECLSLRHVSETHLGEWGWSGRTKGGRVQGPSPGPFPSMPPASEEWASLCCLCLLLLCAFERRRGHRRGQGHSRRGSECPVREACASSGIWALMFVIDSNFSVICTYCYTRNCFRSVEVCRVMELLHTHTYTHFKAICILQTLCLGIGF